MGVTAADPRDTFKHGPSQRLKPDDCDLDGRRQLLGFRGRFRRHEPRVVRLAAAALGLAATLGAGAGVRASLTLLLVRRRENSMRKSDKAVTSRLLPALWLLWLLVLAEDAADQIPTMRRLHNDLTLPWRVAGGALAASSAASSSAALPGYALTGAANALLWQRAWRDAKRELQRLGVQPEPVAVLEHLSVLWLTTLSRRWPYLGLDTVPVAVCLIAIARVDTLARYAALATGRTRSRGVDVAESHASDRPLASRGCSKCGARPMAAR